MPPGVSAHHPVEKDHFHRPLADLGDSAGSDRDITLRDLNVALVHYWLVGMRGGEKVLESLCSLFPRAVIFTHVYDPNNVSDVIRRHVVKQTFVGSLPFARRWYKHYLPLMPLALEQLDLRGYDLVITLESGPAKGILAPVDSTHICYCHTPMRYIWNMYHDYLKSTGVLRRMLVPWIAHRLRQWDLSTAARVDCFVANSQATAARIRRFYGRESLVVYPPVDVDSFDLCNECSGEFLYVDELVPYKRPDLAVEACNRLGLPLVVVGGGEMLDELRRMAGPTVKVLGRQPFPVLRQYLMRCRALLFPGEEDFGIVPVEALACGRPVIALGRGGALETVGHAPGCVLYDEPSLEALVAALQRFLTLPPPPPSALRAVAQRFSRQRFLREMRQVISGALSARALEEAPSLPERWAGVWVSGT